MILFCISFYIYASFSFSFKNMQNIHDKVRANSVIEGVPGQDESDEMEVGQILNH